MLNSAGTSKLEEELSEGFSENSSIAEPGRALKEEESGSDDFIMGSGALFSCGNGTELGALLRTVVAEVFRAVNILKASSAA